jgi:hypothetical protein
MRHPSTRPGRSPLYRSPACTGRTRPDVLHLDGSIPVARYLELLRAVTRHGLDVDALAGGGQDGPDAVVQDHPLPERASL